MNSSTRRTPRSDDYARGFAAIDLTTFVNRHAMGLLDLVETLPRSEPAQEAFDTLFAECNSMFPDPDNQARPMGCIFEFLMGAGSADLEAAIANGATARDVDAELRWYLGRLCELRAQFVAAGIHVPK
jgi:hypothetical protein